jgi:hypothetical protein
MLRRLVAFLAFAAAFIVSARASAAVVRDGDKYAIDLGAARICWVTPIELRSDADCEGLTPENVPPPREDSARVVAMGLVRLEEPGEAPDLALVMVMHVPLAFVQEVDLASARDYAKGAERAIAKELRAGARMRPATDTRVIHSGKLPLIRAVLDADGIPDGADDQLIEHQIHVAAVANDGMYSVAWLSRRRSARTIEGLADASAPSIAIAHPAPPKGDLERRVGIAVGVVMGIGLVLVGTVLFVVLGTRKKPAYVPYAHPSAPPAWHPASADPQWAPPPAPGAPAPVRAWWDSPG